MAPRLRSAVVRFDALPEPVMRVLFLALPVDARARAACVCRSWRAFLADPSLWQVLDLTPAGGLAMRVTGNLMRGAVARAAGQLRTCPHSEYRGTPARSPAVLRAELTFCTAGVFSLNRVPGLGTHGLFLELIVSDGAELQQVNTDHWLSVLQLEEVLAAAPLLQVLSTGVSGTCTELLPVLRNDPPFGPLRVSELERVDYGPPPAADVVALAAAVAAHDSLERLQLVDGHFAHGMNAMLHAAAECRVSWLSFGFNCVFDAESVHALARLLQRGSLTKLEVYSPDFPPSQETSMPVLCAALRTCRTLTHLKLHLSPLDEVSRHDFTELIEAAAAMPALSVLDLWRSTLEDPDDAGRALGGLLRANLPNLRTLNVNACGLGDDGLAPLLDGLAANTHLRWLDCRDNEPSEAFERDELMPALAALAARAEFDE